jgi:hypothetical protein
MAGVSQPSPLTPVRQRAQALAGAGDKAGAIAMLEHAVSLGKVNLGEDDPDVLTTAHQLARVHQDADDPAAARRVLEEAYAAGQWRLGDADPLMLEISYDLGVVAEELGNRHEARKALTRVVEAGRPVLGDLHWAVHRAQLYLDGDTNAVRPPPLPTQERPQGPPTQYPTNLYLHDRRDPGDQPTVLHPTIKPRVTPPPPPPAEPQARVAPQPAGQKRGPALFAAIAAVLAAVLAVAALVFVLADRGRDPEQSDVPTLGGGPSPTDVKLRDFGTSMQVSWTDAGAGKNSFIITGGHPDEVLKPMGEVGPGATTFELQGLNDKLDYCFAVVAVYGTDSFASSAQVCTSRPDPTTTR